MVFARIFTLAGMLALSGCVADHSVHGREAYSASPPPTALPRADSTVMVRAWWFECTDPDDPDARVLLAALNQDSREAGSPPDAMTAVAALQALEFRGKGRLLGHPGITTRCGERASIALVSPEPAVGGNDPWADLRAGSVRGFALSVDPSLGTDGRLGLDLDFLYRAKTEAEDPRHRGMIAQCQNRLTLPDGACAVLGAQRLADEPASSGSRPPTTLLLVVQATTVD